MLRQFLSDKPMSQDVEVFSKDVPPFFFCRADRFFMRNLNILDISLGELGKWNCLIAFFW